jgi:glycosyltransferase domain-containing protein
MMSREPQPGQSDNQAMNDVTCVIPTHNRTPFLRRWLKFYTQFVPEFEVLVVDSSMGSALSGNSTALQDEAGAIRVRHLALNLGLYTKIREALDLVETKWVTLCADDDIVLPAAVRRCARFLAENPGYVSAQGRTAKVYPRRLLMGCDRLKGYSIEDDDALTRCHRLAANWFTNFYAVYRTEDLRETFRLTEQNVDSMAEMFLSQLSAVRGRIKVLPCMHLILEVHPGAAGVQCRGATWPDAEAQFQRFRACFVQEATAAGIDPRLAGEHVERHYSRFRQPSLQKPRRSAVQWLEYWRQSAQERWEDWFHEVNVRHKRPMLQRDVGDAQAEWSVALSLMRKYPDGIPD